MQPRFRPELIARRVQLHRHFNRICFAISVSRFRPCRSPQTQTQAQAQALALACGPGISHLNNQQRGELSPPYDEWVRLDTGLELIWRVALGRIPVLGRVISLPLLFF